METLERDLDLTEIINGEEVMGPSPFGKHQGVVGNLYLKIASFVLTRDLGKVYFSPLDVIFEDEFNRLQPDILFISKNNLNILQDWIRGVPDMVCEIISPGSYERDTKVKKAIYEKYRVPEYWIVMPELEEIQILTIEDAKYKVHSIAAIDGIVQSKVIAGLQVNIRDIFE
ncbi:MAG: Uma2 family endonuclease [Nitrospirae bacterium]|nr:Uma2 family endonuclease [Nitrospirota bacterium]